MIVQIVVALSGAVAAIAVAFIAAGKAADDAVDKRLRELSVVSGGAVGGLPAT